MRKVILFFILICTVVGAWADDKITFTANAPEVVVSGDQFRLSYTVNTKKVRDFRAPNIKEFEVSFIILQSSFLFFIGLNLFELYISSYLFSFPNILSVIIFAATLEIVMPHFLKPVATYTLG